MKWLRALVVAFCLAPIGAQAWWQSVAQQSIAAPTTPPAITYAGTNQSSASTQTQTSGSITIPASVADQFTIVGFADIGVVTLPASITLNPSAGGSITANLVVKWDAASGGTNAPVMGIYAATIPAGSTSMTATIVLGANPFNTGRWVASTIPAANLVSTTATGSGVLHAASNTTATTSTFSTTSAGALFAWAANTNATSNSVTFTGTETFGADDVDSAANGMQYAASHVNNITTNASGSVTATFAQTGNMAVLAAAWR